MADIKYICQILKDVPALVEVGLPVSIRADQRAQKISKYQIGEPQTPNYWTDWGGNYDNNIKTSSVEIYIDGFLQKVDSVDDLINTINSIYIAAPYIYINIEKYTWEYEPFETDIYGAGSDLIGGYATAPRNIQSMISSNDSYPTRLGENIRFPARLDLPNGMLKTLPNPVFGIVLSRTFKIKLENSDGMFDLVESTNFFNTPIELKRTDVSSPYLDDFQTIKRGIVEDLEPRDSSITLIAADPIRTMEQETCRAMEYSNFPGIPEDKKNKTLPIGWGRLTVDLIEIGSGVFLAIDPKYLDSVNDVFDNDGNPVEYTVESGVIKAVGAKYADINARQANRIGEIIISEIENKSRIPYIDRTWDLVEAENYKNNSARISLYWEGGTVKSLISEVQKSDNAFLFEKNDGRLTIRKWGAAYSEHNFSSWVSTAESTKRYQDQKWYMTSVRINYGPKNSELSYIEDSRANNIVEKFHRRVRREFSTHLVEQEDAQALADLLLDRFGRKAEIMKVTLGSPVKEINLLDTLNLAIKDNNRLKSRVTSWIVTGVDPAQDVLELEEA